jgi:hypothetical protein
MRKVFAALTVAALALVTPVPSGAQAANYALAAFGQGNILDGCSGPFCVDPISQQGVFVLNVVCVDRAANPDLKRLMGEVPVIIPDGTGLVGMRTLWTTAAVDACAGAGITVPRTNVILPVLQFGQ